MAKVDLAYLNGFKDRHGRQRFYYRRQGKSIPLPGKPDDPEFIAAYQEAASQFTPASRLRVSTAPASDTFYALAIAFYRSPQFVSLSDASKRTYRFAIDRWLGEHGRRRVTHLERRHVVEHLAIRYDAGGPQAANQLRKVLKILCAFAVANEWRADDPTSGIKKYKSASDGFAPWSEDDIAAYLTRWGVGTRERLALCLLLYSGQRRGDVVRMGRQHRNGDTIRVVQGKTGAQLIIPLHPELAGVLDALPNDNLTYLTTAFGKPFTAAGFGNWFRDACDAAGLSKRSAHGLRKSAARRLAEAGCSTHQIAAITGHKTLSEIERYTASAEQEKMAREAIGRLIGGG